MFTFLFVFSTFNGILPQLSNTTDLRHRRDLSGLQTATDHLQSAARISNAIYLHQGFRKGSINPANFGAEILRLGSNSLSQIDDTALTNGVQALQDLPSKIQDNAEVKKFEEYYGIVEDVLKPLEGVASLKDWPGRKDFEEDILKMKNGSFDVQLVTNITTLASGWINDNNNAKNVKNQVDHNRGKVYLGDLLKKSQDLLSYVNSPPQLPKAFQFKGHQSAASSFSALPRMAQSIDTLDKRASGLKLYDADKQGMKTNLEGLTDSGNKIRTTVPMLQTVRGILQSRANPAYSSEYKLTAGFSGGQKDVDVVFKDLSMPWIQKISDSSKLSSALEPLKGIGANSDSLQKLDGTYIENSDAVNQMISLSETFLSAAANPDDFMNTSEAVFQCVRARSSDQIEPIDTLKKLVNEIDQDLANANAKISSIGSNLKNQDLKNLLTKTVAIVEGYESKNGAELQKVFDDLKNSLPTTKPIDDIDVKVTNLLNPVIDKSGEIEQKFQLIDKFLKSTAPYDAFLQCLRNVPNRDVFFSSIKTLKTLRDGNQEFTSSVTKTSDIAKAVISAKKDLKTIGDVASSVKSSKKPDSLVVFTDMSKHSEMIGGAARGVQSMRKLIEKKQDFQFVVKNLDLVRKELAVASTVKRVKRSVTPSDQALLTDLLAIDGPVQAMLGSLAQLESSTTAPTATNLAGLSSIFKSAQQVQGIDKDLVGMAEAVGRLAQTAQDPNTKQTLVKMASTLAALGSLGLDFSKHAQEFQGCPSSLKQLDVLFAKQKSTPASNNNPSGSSPSGNNGPNGPTGNGTNAAASPLASLLSSTVSSILEATTLGFVEKNLVYIIIGSIVGGSAGVAGIGYLGYLGYHFLLKKKKVEETKPVDPQPDETNIENGEQKKPEDKKKPDDDKGKPKFAYSKEDYTKFAKDYEAVAATCVAEK